MSNYLNLHTYSALADVSFLTHDPECSDGVYLYLLPQRSLAPLKPKPWSEFTLNSRSFAASSPGPASSRFFGIRSVLSQTLDSVKIGSNILFQTIKVTHYRTHIESA
jgi:hypothetical protein